MLDNTFGFIQKAISSSFNLLGLSMPFQGHAIDALQTGRRASFQVAASPRLYFRVAKRSRWAALCLTLAAIACFVWPSAAAASYAPGAPTKEWAWMSGSSTAGSQAGAIGAPGVYGTQGTPAAANLPGQREYAATWTDAKGNLWLFGGYGYDANDLYGYLNDLWKFNPSTNLWTWIGGSNSVGIPGNCQPGVYSFPMGLPNANNIPGGRESASSWTDASGNLWLFGGYGCDGSGIMDPLNDLWEFTPSTGLWTWISGSNVIWDGSRFAEYGSYGTQGTPGPLNNPGGRSGASSWTDASGHLWLFGGAGFDISHSPLTGDLNDIWVFTPSTYLNGGVTATGGT
jgi:hypothetical protein